MFPENILGVSRKTSMTTHDFNEIVVESHFLMHIFLEICFWVIFDILKYFLVHSLPESRRGPCLELFLINIPITQYKKIMISFLMKMKAVRKLSNKQMQGKDKYRGICQENSNSFKTGICWWKKQFVKDKRASGLQLHLKQSKMNYFSYTIELTW